MDIEVNHIAALIMSFQWYPCSLPAFIVRLNYIDCTVEIFQRQPDTPTLLATCSALVVGTSHSHTHPERNRSQDPVDGKG